MHIKIIIIYVMSSYWNLRGLIFRTDYLSRRTHIFLQNHYIKFSKYVTFREDDHTYATNLWTQWESEEVVVSSQMKNWWMYSGLVAIYQTLVTLIILCHNISTSHSELRSMINVSLPIHVMGDVPLASGMRSEIISLWRPLMSCA